MLATSTVFIPTEYEDLRWAVIKLLEGVKRRPYVDTAPNPQSTIGVGFNIEGNTQLMDAVFNALGLVEVGDTDYRARLATALIAPTTTVGLQSALDTIMLERYNALPVDERVGQLQRFELPEGDAVMRDIFDLSVPSFETQVTNWLGSSALQNTPERLVLLSFAYNGLLLKSPKLKAAILAGDRAEA